MMKNPKLEQKFTACSSTTRVDHMLPVGAGAVSERVGASRRRSWSRRMPPRNIHKRVAKNFAQGLTVFARPCGRDRHLDGAVCGTAAPGSSASAPLRRADQILWLGRGYAKLRFTSVKVRLRQTHEELLQ